MNVLVDGVSIYRPGLARVDWKEIPVAIDIERIEVTRGTNRSLTAPTRCSPSSTSSQHPRMFRASARASPPAA
jgi:hypothetical protein